MIIKYIINFFIRKNKKLNKNYLNQNYKKKIKMGQICESNKQKNVKYRNQSMQYPGSNNSTAEGSPQTPENPVFNSMKHFKQKGINDFEIIKMIGKGAFGKVFLVKDKQNGKAYAMKTIIKSEISDTDKNYNKQERLILTYMQSDFIVKLFYAFQDEYKLYMIVNYVEFGDLQQHLKKRGKFSEEEAKFLFCEIIVGLQYLHKKGVVYRDLKPSNILIEGDGHIKLTDFGISKIEFSETNQAETFCGTYQYMAPELFQNKEYGYAADYYSLGITMYELLTGKTPFDQFQNQGESIQKQQKQIQIQLDDIENPILRSLLQQLLSIDHQKRNQNIRNHPYFMDINWQSVINKQIRPVYQPQEYRDGSELCMDSLCTLEENERNEDQIEQQGYFANFSFNYQHQQIYELNGELGDDSEEDDEYKYNKEKFISRNQSLCDNSFQFGKNTQNSFQKPIKTDVIQKNSVYNQNSINNNNKNDVQQKILQKYDSFKNKQQTIQKDNFSFSYMPKVCVIQDEPYDQIRKQLSVEYNNKQLYQMIQNE